MRLHPALSLFLFVWTVAAQSYLPPPEVAPVQLSLRHPRLSFRPANDRGLGRSFDDVRRLYSSDPAFHRIFDNALEAASSTHDPATAAAAWVVTGDDRHARTAAALLEAPISSTGEGRYSNVWSFALAWDWLYGHPALLDSREESAARIAERIETELAWLDGQYMATWHGRNQAANGAMVAALAIGDLPGQQRNLARATAHYAEALRALDFSEGWPEGPSYWIYNRAAPYALAADCFMSATGQERIAGIDIRLVMRKVGLWTIYQFAPNGVFEPYGDSAGSLRLGETGWWEVTADYFAKLSKSPAVAAGGDWFRNRSSSPYGKRLLHWWVVLSYDPSVRPRTDYDPARPELWLRDHLPQTMLFGRDSMGVTFFRDRWGDPDELFASFKAGDLLAHHDHYDTGHFSIQYGGLLAPLTGVYGDPGGYYGAYRLGYAIQTVASNSLLILSPGESAAALRAQKQPVWTALSGGQRVVRPTGFDCLSLEHFKAQRNAGALERATITAFETHPGDFDYIAADITAAYNSTRWAEPGSEPKVSLVTRQLVYLRRERAFVVYDRVECVRPSDTPKLLLHALSKPQTKEERLLAGKDADNGILESRDSRFTVTQGGGLLTAISVLPENQRLLKIGGPDYYAYVEEDGDQSDGFDGVNLSGGDPVQPRDTKQLGLWRVEIEPAIPGVSHRFLTVLVPRLAADGSSIPSVAPVEAGASADAVRVGRTVAVFPRNPKPLESARVAGDHRVIVFNDRGAQR